MRRRNDGAGASPQEEFGDVCFHALGIIDQNREYLQMHLLASADLPTRQALSDIQIESARLDRTVRNAITLYQLENEELSELQPLDLCGLLEKAGRLAPDIQRSLEITLTAESGGIEHCAVMGVPDEAEQLLLHLISNALRACDAGGRVWVSLKQKKTGVALRVEDNGYGLMEEDPTLSYENNAETHQQVIGGLGEQHLDVVKAKLKNKFGVEIGLEAPRIAYRESIRKACQKQGRHKKQTGGHGQFGDVIINFEPCDSEQVVFEEKVFGGSVPKNFFPAVEKGVRLAAEKGVLAGYPVVGLKATLLDGSYHPVDSSEMAFIMAAKLAYKAAMPEAGPVILEPIHTLKAHVPNDNTGDIMGDVTKRRGRVLGMEPDEDGLQTIIAEVPLAELANFTTFIRQTTQGRGWFTTEFARYEVLPEMLVPAVVEQAKKLGNLDESADD